MFPLLLSTTMITTAPTVCVKAARKPSQPKMRRRGPGFYSETKGDCEL